MTRGLIFWVLMLIWFVFALFLNFGGAQLGIGHYGGIANSFLEFVLFLLLGWQVYGPPVHG
jgi:hypothetical protein